ncbi:MAG: YjaG family protein [Aeromonas sp.]
MFGDKFYKRLSELQPWQQTVYTLALAERMYPNYALFCQATGFGSVQVFRKSLDELWQYLTVKGSRVNLSAILEELEAQIPEPSKFSTYGVYPAIDACVALGCAYNSVICRIGEESAEASHASVGTVAGFIELVAERELSDDELYEHELMEAELEFQVELQKRVAFERDSARILAIRTFAAQDGVSNIGISLEE